MRLKQLTVLFITSIWLFSACSIGSPHFKTLRRSSDTIFLRNSFEYFKVDSESYPVWNKVFIETNRQSKYYDQVWDFSDMNAYLKDYNTRRLMHFDTSMLPDEWTPLYKYKGRYCIYRNGNGQRKLELRDSILIEYDMEPSYLGIRKFEKVGSDHYRIQIDDFNTGWGEATEINIYIIDPVNNISVWRYKDPLDSAYHYKLYIAKQNARKFALVVNVANELPDEFEFDPIDFKKLLRRVKE